MLVFLVLTFAGLVLISQDITMEEFLGTMLILWISLKFFTRQRSVEVSELTIIVHDGEERSDKENQFQGKIEEKKSRFPAMGTRPRLEVIDGGKE